ncbi:MAG: indolepyruvate oxidoreductase subunit beta [Bacteroidales bacterium]|nr:indolepyruvate oxidoreductase subunit beta [Bacteroidales bacterium]
MKTDIVLAGVGGQGILSIAAAIGLAAVKEDLYIKQSEIHGMSQKGGEVYSHLRLSDKPVYSDMIPLGQGDLILSVEPLESLRYLPFLKKKGWLVTNSRGYVNIPNYPEPETLVKEIEKIPNHLLVDADRIAREAGSLKAANMVMLGAAAPFIQVSEENLEEAIRTLFARKGEAVVEKNVNAFRAGLKEAGKAS